VDRRSFLVSSLAAGALACTALPAAAAESGALAWPGPIGLEVYTVRDLFAKAPLATMRQVAAIGYKAMELGLATLPKGGPATARADLRQAGLVSWSGTWSMPGSATEWDKTMGQAQELGMKYIVCMTPVVKPASFWREQAGLLARAGDQCAQRGLQLCYHAHWPEFVSSGGEPTGYEILMQNTTPRQLMFEMDVFWMVWAKQDPVAWFHRAPGRFPILHIKDMKKQLPAGDAFDSWPKTGTIPFTYVGGGRIDWRSIFANVKLAGTQHIYVEQDECDLPVLESCRRSYDYLRKLRL